MNNNLPTYADVVDAAEKLSGIAVQTPLLRNAQLDALVGMPVYVKAEPLQQTGSFKIRGAYNRICRLTAEERKRGVVAFSSGNHAQGVARAAKLLGVEAIIVMPEDSPQIKIDGVRRDGAEIVFYDRFNQSREEIAATIAQDKGSIVVPSYDDFYVMSGQGTAGLEIVNQYPDTALPQALVCCVGGGGLISGISLAVHEHWADTRIYGAEPQDFDDHARSLQSGQRETNSSDARSICDALLSPSPGELTFAVNRQHLTGIGCVSDEEVKAAVRFAFLALKVVCEPGGAAALAALMAGKIPLSGTDPVVVVLTGGNVDPARFSEILMSAAQI